MDITREKYIIYSEPHAALNVGWDWFVLLILFLFQLILYTSDDQFLASLGTVISSLTIMAVLLTAALRIASRDSNALWTPLFWLRIAGGVFIGIGGLVPNIANDETLRYIFSIAEFDNISHLKVMIIQTLGIFITLILSGIFLKYLKISNIHEHDRSENSSKTLKYATYFLIIGGILRYGIAIPVAFGTSPVVAGVLLSLANIYYVGLVLLTIYSVDNRGRYLTLLVCLISLDAVFSILTFSKRQVVLLILFPALGYLSRSFSRRGLVVVAVSILTLFPFLQNIVEFGRAELLSVSGDAVRGSMGDRLEVLSRYTLNYQQENVPAERQSALIRLSYVNTDAFVVDQYDNGSPGYSYQNILAIFIPRFLWPDKPTITTVGIDLYFMLTGQVGSSFGTTLWGEAYWNFGGLGVILVSVPIALIMSFFSHISLVAMRKQDWLLMPIVIIGLTIGTRLDGFFIADIAGPAVIGIVLLGILLFGRKLVQSPER